MLRQGLIVFVLALAVCWPRTMYAQISPGELSKAHESFEGISNCTQCHESGQGLSNAKCLVCHGEIERQVQRKRGFHFANASGTCVSCHKEHLGREAAITRFDERGFDHAKTGFVLTGKHGTLICGKCHTDKNVKDPDTQKMLAKNPHKTFLGLDDRCISCHEDRHRGTAGTACQSCHSTDSWSPAAVFDHAKAKFPLVGKHKSVACAQCHAGLSNKTANEPILLATKSFADCNACHTSPHGRQFTDKACKSCHTAEGWNIVVGFDHSATKFPLAGKHLTIGCEQCHTAMSQSKGRAVSFVTKSFKDCTPCHSSSHNQNISERACRSCHVDEGWGMSADVSFDHSLTRFVLRGKHKELRCEQCHKPVRNVTFAQRFFVEYKLCTDCHEDYHKGLFREKYSNNCETCHDEKGFKPSKFTIENHVQSRFELAGAHAAVPCDNCHRTSEGGKREFRFTNLRCQACHPDHHNGQFDKEMLSLSCARCHSTKTWKMTSFDHVKTIFPLIGKHLLVKCSDCHKEEVVGGLKLAQYIGVPTDCQSCHKDIHGGQFDLSGVTRCIACHSTNGWHILVFNHDVQSTFSLTGAHKNVPCGSCHKEDQIGGANLVRYRPIQTTCESCHRGKM